jgi:catechol 2,3-dioxygenase-like lactoylglutathione lyase family enzyme
MKFKFDHMNLCTENVPRITEFYRTLFGLEPVHGYVRVGSRRSAHCRNA